MEQPINQFDSTPKNNSVLLPIVTSVILTAIIVGGGIFWWMNQKQQVMNDEVVSLRSQVEQLKQASPTSMNQKQQVMNDEVVSLRSQVEQLKQASPTSPTTSNSQNDELIEAKFKLAIRDFWGVREVFRNPQNKNQFYYISDDSSGHHIWVYDLSKDKTYQQNGYFNIPEGNTLLLNQKLAQYQEFRGVGFSGNKFVFVETSTDNSPGPCFSPWFYSNLEYIDLGVTSPTRKSFTLPADPKRAEEQKVSDCQKTL